METPFYKLLLGFLYPMDPWLLKFQSLKLDNYLNKNHPVYDESVFLNAKEELKAVLERIDYAIYTFFESRNDLFTDLLDKYERCFSLVSDTKKIPLKANQEQLVFDEDLRTGLGVFQEDLSMFLTSERYFLIKGEFNEKKHYALLSNDILFIGERKTKYSVIKIMDIKEITVKLNETNDTLVICYSNFEMELTHSTLAFEFYDVLTDLNYKKTEEIKVQTDGFVDFCQKTQRFKELLFYFSKDKEKCIPISLKQAQTGTQLVDLSKLKELNEGTPAVVRSQVEYFRSRFQDGMADISRIQPLSGLIPSLFSYLKEYTAALVQFCNINAISPCVYAIAVEEFCKMILDSLKNRLELHYFMHKEDFSGLLKKSLKFEGFNFSYLVDEVDLRKYYLQKAKKRISDILSSYFHN